MPDNDGRVFTDPNTHTEIYCGICGDKMLVTRGIYGPRSFAMAVGNMKSLHDSFTCPNLKSDWHIQIANILDEARKTSSKILTDLLKQEADSILKKRHAQRMYNVACQSSNKLNFTSKVQLSVI